MHNYYHNDRYNQKSTLGRHFNVWHDYACAFVLLPARNRAHSIGGSLTSDISEVPVLMCAVSVPDIRSA